MPWPDSYCVAARSSITSRTAPSAALAMRSVSCLWSRDVETNASWLESGLHSTSAHSLPRQTTWSHSVDRCWSGGICRGTTRGASTSTITRRIIATVSSPGSGYFHACSTGCPTLVSTRYISPTLRWSCWKVAIFFEAADQATITRSVFTHTGLSSAQELSFTPSVESWVSLPVAISRTHRLYSRMKAVFFLSGEGASVRPRPPVAVPPCSTAHWLAWRSHRYRCAPIWNETPNEGETASSDSSIALNGSLFASYFFPVAAERAAASLAWSKAGSLASLAGSKSTKRAPSASVSRYHRRSSGVHAGCTE